MRRFVLTSLTACLSALAFIASGSAAEPSGMTTSTISPDVIYDWNLYAASDEPVYGYYIRYTRPDNTWFEFGPYASEYDAYYRLWFNVEHNVYPSSYEAEVIERELPPAWQFFARYDKYADAAAMADLLESFGLLTDIRRVSALRLQSRLLP